MYEEFKQVILVRDDLKMSKGKIAAQVAHACVEAVLRSDKVLVSKWRSSGMKKIVLKITSKEDLYKYMQFAKDSGLQTALITDAGKTEIAPMTPTCVAIGPDLEKKIDVITKDLKSL